MSNSQADQLADQIKQLLRGKPVDGDAVLSGVVLVDALAALAKQQASPEAQRVCVKPCTAESCETGCALPGDCLAEFASAPQCEQAGAVPGLGRLTAHGNAVEMQFVDERSAEAFMEQCETTVDVSLLPAQQAREQAALPTWPHVGADESGAAVLEWWSGPRKLTLYTCAPAGEALLKSWGTNLETEMAYVPVTEANQVREAFSWLAQGTTPAAGVGEQATGGEPWPHISSDEAGAATMEWWNGERKLTLYTVSPPYEALIKSWSEDAGHITAFVPTNDAAQVEAAFEWLRAAPKPAQAEPMSDALWKALERMDRARGWLTGGAPYAACNWAVLDTSDLRAILAEAGIEEKT